MGRKRVYVAFDYDDLEVKQSLIAQSSLPDCPFELVDGSINRHIPTRWHVEARRLIALADCVVVLCGRQTHQAAGVAFELQVAQELGRRYFLLGASRTAKPTKPPNARSDDRIWTFRWPTLAALLDGRTPPPDAAL